MSLNVDDLTAALQELERSTLACEQHIEALQRTSNLLNHIDHHDHHAASHTVAQRKTVSQYQHLRNLTANLQLDLNEEALRGSDRCEAKAAWTAASTAKTLTTHEKLFDTLEPLSTQTKDSTLDTNTTRNGELLQALQHTIADTIRTKLNNIYLRALLEPQQAEIDGNPTSQSVSSPLHNDEDTATLEAELASLSSDIDAVVEMRTLHDHGTGIQALHASIARTQTQLHLAKEQYILTQLTKMNRELVGLLDESGFLLSERLLRQHLDQHLHSVKLDPHRRESRHDSISAFPVQITDRSRLAALRTRLDLDTSRGLNSLSADRHKIEDELGKFTTGVQDVLNRQQRYAELLNLTTATEQGETSGESIMAECGTTLDQLDGKIADIKNKIDALSSRSR